MERLGFGIIIGIGLASLTRISRSTVKRALKLGITAAEALREALSEGKESFTDLLAEVKEEIAREPRGAEMGGSVAPEHEKPEPPAVN